MAKVTIDNICIKDIKGYEGLYAVTSCGKVWSYISNKFISQWDNKKGYLYVTLRKDGQKKNRRVSRLVAEAYVPNPDPKHFKKVDHENQNTYDNYASNLRWVDNIINHCNRRNNIPVMDITTCEIHCSTAKAVKMTGVSRKQILKECDYYLENGEAKRFVYFNKLSEDEMKKFIWDYCERQTRKKNNLKKGA